MSSPPPPLVHAATRTPKRQRPLHPLEDLHDASRWIKEKMHKIRDLAVVARYLEEKVDPYLRAVKRQIDSRDDIIEQQADRIRGLEDPIPPENLQGRIKALERQVGERDVWIGTRDRMLAKRDASIRQQTEMIDKLGAAVNSNHEVIETRNGTIARLEAELHAARKALEE